MVGDIMSNIYNSHLDIFELFFLFNKKRSLNPTFHREIKHSAHFKYTANVFTNTTFTFLQSEHLRMCQPVMVALYENE